MFPYDTRVRVLNVPCSFGHSAFDLWIDVEYVDTLIWM